MRGLPEPGYILCICEVCGIYQRVFAGCRGRGAMAGCHCTVIWLEGDGQRGVRGRGGIAGCPCIVLWVRMMANFVAVDVVPLQGAVVVCYGWGRGG